MNFSSESGLCFAFFSVAWSFPFIVLACQSLNRIQKKITNTLAHAEKVAKLLTYRRQNVSLLLQAKSLQMNNIVVSLVCFPFTEIILGIAETC